MSNNAIELSNVTKTFGDKVAVSDLDLAIPEGAIYGFIGPNGSGKTTSIRMILRIFRPDTGRIVVMGSDHGDCADDRIGYLPEERGLYPKMTVKSVLQYYARLKGHYNCNADIDVWLSRLGGDGWQNKKIESLSKGMAQKVQFISAVIAKPKLLILDEPFSGLDPVNLEVLRSAILKLREDGTTIIFSTHDMDVAERMCDTVFMILNGSKVLDGTLRSIQNQYPADELKIRLAEGQMLPGNLSGAIETENRGQYIHVKLESAESAESVLQQLVKSCRVEHFELLRPSLHNIFVRIVGEDAIADKQPVLADVS